MSSEQRRSPTATGTGRRRAAAALLLAAPVLAIVAAVAPSDVSGRWLQAGLAVAAGLAVVVAAPRSGRAAVAWRTLGVGLTVWGAGLLAAVASYRDHEAIPSPNPTDVPCLVGIGLLAAALVLMAVARSERVDWIPRIDAFIVAIGGAGVIVALFAGELADRADSQAERIVSLLSLGMAALVATAVVRLALTGARRLVAGRFLVVSSLPLLAGAGLLRAHQLDLTATHIERVGLGLATLGSLGLAASSVHPSAVRIGDVEHRPAHTLPHIHLAVLVAAVVATPVATTVQLLRDVEVDGVLVASTATVLTLLLVARLQLVVRSGQRQARRSQALRDAALAIAAGRNADEVRRAGLTAAVALTGGKVRYAAWLVGNERGTMSPLDVAGPDRPLRREDTDLDAVLAHVADLGERSLRLADRQGHEILVAPVPRRLGGLEALALAPRRASVHELDEAMTVLGTHCGLALDALEQSRELQQRRGEARMQQLVRHSSDAVLIVGRDRIIRYQTPSVVRVLGYLAVDLDGQPVTRMVHHDDIGHFEHFLDSLVQIAPEGSRTLEVQLRRADESVIHSEVVGINLLDNPDVHGVVLSIRDVTGRRALQDQLRHQAFHDSLTGLANRALFADRVGHALDRVRRSDSITPAVLFIDLDDFKMVNDSMGHGAGDELLVVLAERLQGVLRAGDTAARLGGDEFAILLEDAPDLDAIEEVAERVLDAVSESATIAGRELHVRASVGVATRIQADMSPDELLRNADLAMYAAKANGKGRVEVFEPSMHRRVVDLLTVRADLERAVERGTIDVEYQPIVHLSDGEVVGFEALARWNHPERGPVGPSEFLPVAEDSGIIVPLGRLVLSAALQQLSRWRRDGAGRAWTVSVNFSAREVLAPDLVEAVQDALRDAHLEPRALVCELTETSLLVDTDQVLHRIHRLKELGVQIAIDNFGTGYSSLSYLQRVPFDIVKIDRGLVSALRTQEPPRTVARTIIDLVRTLDRVVVAQGVEQQAEVDGLLQLGCQLGQGFLLHRPVDASTLSDDLGLVGAGG
ncbi:MAG TPA: EAL domain-containing protein [Acidimicrobiales bacterium]|nr:EAL domain-containing protein [Acidimicrobiales bacterium]